LKISKIITMNWEDKYRKGDADYDAYKARIPKNDRSYYCPYDRHASGDPIPWIYPETKRPDAPVYPKEPKREFEDVTTSRLKEMENEAVAVEDYETAARIRDEIKRRL
jgi:hypothetical protein